MNAANIFANLPDGTVIDAFHMLMDGRKVRVYPGTGRKVDPADLCSPVTWEGDSIGCGESELVDLTDPEGNWATIAASKVQAHEVWNRIDNYGQMRIKGALQHTALLNSPMRNR